MHSLPPLRALEIFETLGHCLSVQEAARRLGITSGAVSQQIKLLETHLDVALFFKEGKRIHLTAAGSNFHTACKQSFELLRAAQSDLEWSKNDISMRISALPSMLDAWLSPRILDWQRQNYPAASLQLIGEHSEPNLGIDNIDFRINYGQTQERQAHQVELYTDCVVPVLSPALLAKQSLDSPSDLLKFVLLAVDWQPKFTSPPSWYDWFQLYAPDTMPNTLPIPITFTLSHMAVSAALHGQGVALAQYSSVMQLLQSGALVMPFTKAISLPWPYVLHWHNNTFHKAHNRQLHRWLLAQAKQQQEACTRLLTLP